MELTIESYGRINRLGQLLSDYDRDRRSDPSVNLLDYTALYTAHYPELGLIGDLERSIIYYQHAWITTPDEARGYLPMMDFVAWKLTEDAAILANMLNAAS